MYAQTTQVGEERSFNITEPSTVCLEHMLKKSKSYRK